MSDNGILERKDATPWRSILAGMRVLNQEAYAAQCSADAIREQEGSKGYEEGFAAGHQKGLGEWIGAAAAFQARLRELSQVMRKRF